MAEESGLGECEEKEGFLDKANYFFGEHPWLFYALFFFSLALFLFAVFVPAQETGTQQLGAMYDFNYGPVIVYKNVFDESSRHLERIVVSSQGGAKMLSLFVLVPKALAQSSADVSLASNGKISVIKADPVYRVDAKDSDSISLELSVEGEKPDNCSLLLVLHSDAVSQMNQAQLQAVVDALVAKDTPGLDCDKANEIERDLSARVYKAITQK